MKVASSGLDCVGNKELQELGIKIRGKYKTCTLMSLGKLPLRPLCQTELSSLLLENLEKVQARRIRKVEKKMQFAI